MTIQSKDRVPELDGLRGIAILLVVIWHYVVAGQKGEPGSIHALLVEALRLSWSGVELFFVLSGFLICSILLQNKDKPGFFKRFFTRRALRIIPLYYLYLVIFAIGAFYFEKGHFQSIAELFQGRGPHLPFFLFVQNFWMAITGLWGASGLTVTWSLAVEEQFYILLPLLVFFLPRLILVWVICSLILFAPVFRIVSHEFLTHGNLAAYWLLPGHLDALGAGALIALTKNHSFWSKIVSSQMILKLFWFLALFSVLFLNYTEPQVGSWSVNSYGHSLLALFYALSLVLVLIASESNKKSFLTFSGLRFLGLVSYGVYLLHYPIAIIMHGVILGGRPRCGDFVTGMVTLAAFVVTLLVSHLSFRYFESRVLGVAK